MNFTHTSAEILNLISEPYTAEENVAAFFLFQ